MKRMKEFLGKTIVMLLSFYTFTKIIFGWIYPLTDKIRIAGTLSDYIQFLLIFLVLLFLYYAVDRLVIRFSNKYLFVLLSVINFILVYTVMYYAMRGVLSIQ